MDARVLLYNVAWVTGAAATGLAAPAVGHMMGPFDPSATQYGANFPGDWNLVLKSVGAHLAIVGFILLPWPMAGLARRIQYSVVALVFILSGLFESIIGQHAGRILGWHHLWLLGVGVAAVITAARSRTRPVSSPAA